MQIHVNRADCDPDLVEGKAISGVDGQVTTTARGDRARTDYRSHFRRKGRVVKFVVSLFQMNATMGLSSEGTAY